MRNDYFTTKTLGQAFGFALVMLAVLPARAQEPVKPDADGVQRIRMVGGSYFFKPGHIVVNANVPVELLASRESGITPHNLVIRAPEAGISVEEDLGTDPKKILFTATKPGKYAIYCSKKLPFVASHRAKGMEGLLEVVP
ncbi:MAG TPA: quinol oxidase [Burkholderiales bacterium]|nr:quinol oxidase [Burkholderiales bacterium]